MSGFLSKNVILSSVNKLDTNSYDNVIDILSHLFYIKLTSDDYTEADNCIIKVLNCIKGEKVKILNGKVKTMVIKLCNQFISNTSLIIKLGDKKYIVSTTYN